MPQFSRQGFTLVELMIVIAIIGVLAAAMFPQVNAYLSRARDMTKVLEVRDLNAGYTAYFTDKNTYLIPGTGYASLGEGWINYVEPPFYPKSILSELQDRGYIDRAIKQKIVTNNHEPPVSRNVAPCATTINSQDLYMLYFDNTTERYSISAYLEYPKTEYVDNIQLSYSGIGVNGSCSVYGRNYAVGKN